MPHRCPPRGRRPTQVGLGVSSIVGFVIIAGAPHMNLGIVFSALCMLVQGVECVSWALAEKLHIGPIEEFVEWAETGEDELTTQARARALAHPRRVSAPSGCLSRSAVRFHLAHSRARARPRTGSRR